MKVSVATTMKAAVIRDRGQKVLVYEEVPTPTPAADEVLVRVRAVGICGSDVHGFFDPVSVARVPDLIMGHEAAGEVAQLGPEVSGFAVGDRVAIDPQVICGVCEPCRHGWTVCDNKRVIGAATRGFVHGAMADYVVVRASQLLKLPDELSFEAGALVEPMSNAIHVLNRVKFDLGDTVAVLGAGPLGLCIIQAARLAGAGTVVATDVTEFRLAKALDLGANHAWHAHEATQLVRELTGGRGADVRKRGSVMFFGAVTQNVNVPLLPILWKELSLIGCTGAARESQTAIDLMASGRLITDPIVTHRMPLSEAQQAFELLHSPGNTAIKVVLVP
jgi:threonine dehydrogenase-like Zn-dependent dehydrogenase